MEAKVRWRATAFSAHEQSALLGHYVLKSSIQPYLVIVNSEAHRLFLYQQEGGRYHEVANYYVSIGRKGAGKQYRGDLKTPVGVYQVVKKLPDERLPELYGVAALTLNYPNQWDRQLGRTGSGIWLHGTPRYTYSRPPLASRGCVVLNNPAMEDLINRYRLSPETPVIIASNVDPKEMTIDAEENKQQVLSKINQWLRSQQQYQVDWSQVGVFEYPGEKDLYYVSFPAKVGQQNQIVEQYWKKKSNDAGGGWQLVLEVEQATVAGQNHRYS
ncbi:MAG: L,D-transpeptidase family protein, partial [Hydrogenovibrio sp.]|nr:L,D-transpeptidase family protein [Hydrogenovibrio sp.]